MTCCGCGDNDEPDNQANSSSTPEDFDLLPQEYDPKYGSRAPLKQLFSNNCDCQFQVNQFYMTESSKVL